MKKSRLIKIIIFICLLLLNLYVYRFRILDFISSKFYKGYRLEEMSMDQKLEDFDDFYTTMLNSVPYLEEIKELYQIDFEQRRDYYQEEILKTENNYQFYCTMKAISKDLVSFHTDICFPLYSNLRGLACYHSKETLAHLGKKAQIDAWNEEIKNAIQEYENLSILRVGYADGEYLVDDRFLPEKYAYLRGYRLVKINEIDANQYMTEHISTFKLQYDHLHNQTYRNAYAFNDSRGQEVSVVWSNGEEVQTVEMYLDLGAEVASSYGYLFSEHWNYYNPYEPSLQMHRDDENQLEYIKINNFENNDGKELRTYLENAAYDTIVIDLRDNYGGMLNYAKDYIYPVLYEQDTTQRYEWMVPDSQSNQFMTKDWTVRLLYRHKKDDGMRYYSAKQSYKGRSKNTRQIYYLIGPGTGSAADTYMRMIKDNGLGTIVGNVTGGEGLGASFICDSLENSSLVYVYYPSVAVNQTTQEKIIEGTEPDYYVSISRDDFFLKQQYVIDGTATEYDKRLEYDTILKWVIEHKEQ